MKEVIEKAKKAFEVKNIVATLPTEVKNNALLFMAEELVKKKDLIIKENKKDMIKGEEKGLSKSLLDRLLLNEKRIHGIAEGLKVVASLPDPVGEVVSGWQRPNGLRIMKMRVPIGLIGMIYEARPNVTADAIGLTLKSGNCVILRGGSEAINSNIVIWKILSEAAYRSGIPEGSIQLIETTNREAVFTLLTLTEYLDVVIPRGSAKFINFVKENAKVPVIETGAGVVHIFVDESANVDMAKRIIVNAKVQRPSVCNAVEKILFHRKVKETHITPILDALKEKGVTIIGDREVQEVYEDTIPSTEEDWTKEYLDLKIAVKVVSNVDEAIKHINKYGTHHSDAIITEDYSNAMKFLSSVDSSCVYVNASTRFTDGFEFGFGAEIGISTQKLHARGPMGLKELTTTKYIIFGNGQVRK